MATPEFIAGVKAMVGKYVRLKVIRLKKEDDDPVNPVHGTYLYDVVGIAEKVDIHQASKRVPPPLCIYVRGTEYVAVDLDRIDEIDDEVPAEQMKTVKFGPLGRPNQ